MRVYMWVGRSLVGMAQQTVPLPVNRTGAVGALLESAYVSIADYGPRPLYPGSPETIPARFRKPHSVLYSAYEHFTAPNG